MFGAFLAGMAGFAWVISSTAGYHFRTTLIAVFNVYAVILPMLAGAESVRDCEWSPGPKSLRGQSRVKSR